MRFRKLRIVWSVAWGIVCVLLIVLWVRSYGTADRLHGRIKGKQSFLVASKEGRVAAVVFQWHGAENWWQWETFSYPVDDEMSFPVGPIEQYEKSLGFGWLSRPMYSVMRSKQTLPDGTTLVVGGAATTWLDGAGPIVPYWLLVLFAGACAPTPWIRKRFSLRTLLIATTVVAVAMGLIVYAMK